MFYRAACAQSAHFLGISMYTVGRLEKTKPQNIFDQFIGEQELGNLQNCEFHAPHQPRACLEGCTSIYHFKSFSIQAGLDSNPNNDLKLFSNTKYLGAKSSWKKLEFHILYNVRYGK